MEVNVKANKVKKRVCIYMPIDLNSEVKELCKEENLSENKLSLKAIEYYVKYLKNAKGKTINA